MAEKSLFVRAPAHEIDYDTTVRWARSHTIPESFEKIRVIDVLGGILYYVRNSPQT